jgi:hypothetical protein
VNFNVQDPGCKLGIGATQNSVQWVRVYVSGTRRSGREPDCCHHFITRLTLREEPRMRMFENRLLRILFVPKMDEMTGE